MQLNENQQEIDNIKKDMYLQNQKVKEIWEMVSEQRNVNNTFLG